MSKSLSLSIRYSLYLIILGFCIQLFSTQPATAQPNFPPDSPPAQSGKQPESPPPMSHQPSANADKLVDFVPPNAKVTQLDTGSGKRADAAIHTSGDHVFISKNDTVAVVIEQETFPNRAKIQFTEIDAPESKGLTTATDIAGPPISDDIRVQFEIEVIHNNNVQISSFDKRVRLVADLRAYTQNFDPSGGEFYLAYRDPEDPQVWHDVPIWVHQSGGLISAEVTHFSEWTAGWRPQPWTPLWTPPSVSEFSGAATYSYPIASHLTQNQVK